jgi:hypothetical protein
MATTVLLTMASRDRLISSESTSRVDRCLSGTAVADVVR